MKLSISNIGWPAEKDLAAYGLMEKYGFTGLEIAPTRIFPEAPYDKAQEARAWSQQLREAYGLSISSMQSIWHGRQEGIFGSEEERAKLLGYTKKAIDFAAAIGCENLVFGCPRNRNVPEGANRQAAVAFFRELGDYAAKRGAVIGMEANPPIYHTNYVNDTPSALELIRQVGSAGFLLNLDVGTMVWNKEGIKELEGNVNLIHHVHISEPWLKPIQERSLHRELAELLKAEHYEGFLSVEMGMGEDLSLIERTLEYVRSLAAPKGAEMRGI